MGFCSTRYLFLSICLVQMLSVVQRQAFDFLGFLWIPILVNFFEIIFIILGFFGAYQYRPKYIISYVLWHIFWMGWNIFFICLYLNIGELDHRNNKVLKLDPKSESWWMNEGPGCRSVVPLKDEPTKADVENCVFDYVQVEIFQAGLQCFLSIFGVIFGICLSRVFLEEDDTSLHSKSTSRAKSTSKSGGSNGSNVNNNTKRMSLYSIEFSSQADHESDNNDFENDHLPQPVSPKPMTPRRVKRRSVMTRGSSGRPSTNSTRRHHTNTARSSTRSSRRGVQNPVTRLLEQQQQHQHQLKNHPYDSPASPSPPIEPLPPNYYNSVSSCNLVGASQSTWQSNGHSNPTYQQSSTQSLNDNPEDFDDLYNNRPASVRSSYSNFHGTRAINFNHPPPPPPPSAKQHHYHSHATPQVPQKRNHHNRNSMRSMAFLNNGPPAYSSSQGQVDSETTI